jgi:hypothetical protein
MTGRRGLTISVLSCGVAGAIALLAASRGWGTVTVLRPAPLAAVVQQKTGDSWVPALPALSVVAIAGAGALLALKGPLRRVIGGLLTVCGLGCAAAAIVGLVQGADPWWPALATLAGLVIAAAGVQTVRHANSWPAMGARYERPTPKKTDEKTTGVSKAELWDALDRGEDPTS